MFMKTKIINIIVFVLCSFSFAADPVAEFTFDNNLNDSYSNGTMTQVSVNSSSYGTNATGSYWQWTTTDNEGGGLQLDLTLDHEDDYSIGIKFEYDVISSGYEKIIDYKNRTSDHGFYFYNHKIHFYPGSASATGVNSYTQGNVYDLVVTRDASTDEFKAYIVQLDGTVTLEFTYSDEDSGEPHSPSTGESRFGLFYDDETGYEEATTGGKVYSVKVWGYVLTQSEIGSAMTTVTFTNGSGYVGSISQNSTNQPFGRFALTGAESGSNLTATTIKLNGTRSGATNFKLWASADNAFGGDTQLGSTVAADPGTGNTVSFSSFTSSIGTSASYYFITCDASESASGVVQGVIVNNAALTISDGVLSGSISNAALSSSDVSLPVELTSFTADNTRAGEITLNWVTESEIENLGFILERRQASEGSSQAEWIEITSYVTDESLRGQGSVTYRTEYNYTDKTVNAGETYDYRLADVSYTGEKVYHALNVLGIKVTELPNKFALLPAYPNPFNPETVIRYQLSADANVLLQVYDVSGRLVTTLVNKPQFAGCYSVKWTAKNHASGEYICKLSMGDYSITQKLVLIK